MRLKELFQNKMFYISLVVLFFVIIIVVIASYNFHADIRRTLYLDTSSENVLVSSPDFSTFYTYDTEIDANLTPNYSGEFKVKVIDATTTQTIEFQVYDDDDTALGSSVLIINEDYYSVHFNVARKTRNLKLKYKTTTDSVLSVYRVELIVKR